VQWVSMCRWRVFLVVLSVWDNLTRHVIGPCTVTSMRRHASGTSTHSQARPRTDDVLPSSVIIFHAPFHGLWKNTEELRCGVRAVASLPHRLASGEVFGYTVRCSNT